MNWIVFAVAVWLTLGVQWGFAAALKLGATDIAPYFPVVFVVWLGLWARAHHAIAAALITGALWDISQHATTVTGQAVVILGPRALGCLLGVYLVLTLRGVMLRKNLLTIVMLSALAALLCQLVVTMLLTVRGVIDPAVVVQPPLAKLGVRSASAVYTGFVAAAVGPLLEAFKPLFGFTAGGMASFRPH
jgi:hypothetical protein